MWHITRAVNGIGSQATYDEVITSLGAWSLCKMFSGKEHCSNGEEEMHKDTVSWDWLKYRYVCIDYCYSVGCLSHQLGIYIIIHVL